MVWVFFRAPLTRNLSRGGPFKPATAGDLREECFNIRRASERRCDDSRNSTTSMVFFCELWMEIAASDHRKATSKARAPFRQVAPCGHSQSAKCSGRAPGPPPGGSQKIKLFADNTEGGFEFLSISPFVFKRRCPTDRRLLWTQMKTFDPACRFLMLDMR